MTNKTEFTDEDVMRLPWRLGYLQGWSIVGMNHYRVGGVKYLYVSMKQGNFCIVSQGTDQEDVFVDLERQAQRLFEDQENDNQK